MFQHLDLDQHLDGVLVGPAHPLYAAVDERLIELLIPLVDVIAVYIDETTEAPYI